MKISYNVTGSKRKELVQAISRELKTEAKYCGAPGFTYEVGGLRIDRDGTVSGPDNRGLIADLEGLYSLVPTEKAYETAGISATPSDESDLEPRYTEEELGLGLHHCDPIGEDRDTQARDAGFVLFKLGRVAAPPGVRDGPSQQGRVVPGADEGVQLVVRDAPVRQDRPSERGGRGGHVASDL